MTTLTWVTLEPPDRSRGGGSIREAHLLSAVASRAETHLITVGALGDASVRSTLASVTELTPRVTSPPAWRPHRQARDLWRALAVRQPAEVVDLRRTVEDIRRVLVDGRTDVVCIEHHGLAHLLPPEHRSRWTLTFPHVPSVVAGHAAAIASSGRQRWLLERERAAARRLERWIADRYDVVVAVAEDDAAALPGQVVVAPNGVDVDAFTPAPLPTEPRVVFTGSLAYLPNVDGIRWFCDDVVPGLRDLAPSFELEVVGREPTPEVRALDALANVRVVGAVPDIAAHLHRARVAVVPLRIGSGTRLKALEAMAAGRPVVGTSIGLAGLGLRDGEHALFADDAPSLTRAIARVLDDDALAARLAENGRRVAVERFGWDVIGAAFAAAVLGSDEDGADPGRRR